MILGGFKGRKWHQGLTFDNLGAYEGLCVTSHATTTWVFLCLKWPWGQMRPQKGPRQVLGPYGRAHEPTGHLRDSPDTAVGGGYNGRGQEGRCWTLMPLNYDAEQRRQRDTQTERAVEPLLPTAPGGTEGRQRHTPTYTYSSTSLQ
jgi:hypothetical protein